MEMPGLPFSMSSLEEDWQNAEHSMGVCPCFFPIVCLYPDPLKQTSIMAVVFDEGVVVAADSRTTTGPEKKTS